MLLISSKIMSTLFLFDFIFCPPHPRESCDKGTFAGHMPMIQSHITAILWYQANECIAEGWLRIQCKSWINVSFWNKFTTVLLCVPTIFFGMSWMFLVGISWSFDTPYTRTLFQIKLDRNFICLFFFALFLRCMARFDNLSQTTKELKNS